MPKDPYQLYLKALEKKRAPAMAQAIKLIEADQHDEAERAVTGVDDSIYGAVAIAKLYKQHLISLVESGAAKTNKPHAEEVFRRAKKWAWSAYPEAHTEVEAENYSDGQAQDLAALIAILGYEPQPSWPK